MCTSSKNIVMGWTHFKEHSRAYWAHSVQQILELEINPRVPAAAKSLPSCLTLWDPIDGSPPGSAVPGILQETTLERVAISFSNAWKWKVKVKSLSHVRLLATPWTAAHQAPPSMGFSRPEYWSGVPVPSYMTTAKTTALTRRTFVGKVMSLSFNMLSRLVITFLSRSKCLLISWLKFHHLQWFLEPRKIKSATVSTFSHLFPMKWWDWMPWS